MTTRTIKINILIFLFLLIASRVCFSQEQNLEFTIDAQASTVALPSIMRPAIDLSGRGSTNDASWPQNLSAQNVLDIWQKDIGFSGVYRLQFNLWEISQLAKNKEEQKKLLDNYESVIKKISDSGGIAILDIFGTPAGMGRVLDKKSAPVNLRAFKAFVKSYIKEFSCDKKYNIWYEVWSAPDLEDFFLGRKNEYFALYRSVAQAVMELREETKTYIPIGGPSTSWWFQNMEPSTVLRPEKSLIYELIKFCAHYRLPLDFISWHAYSTDPWAEKANTPYKKTEVELIRNWLSYFNMNTNIPLIVSEWNYDIGANVIPERKDKSFVAASFIPARLKGMYDSGIDYQVFFSLEDFYSKEEGVGRNIGVFSFESAGESYKNIPKAMYNSFLMLSRLNNRLLQVEPKNNDEFSGIIATKDDEYITLLIYYYIDPEIAKSYISRDIASLSPVDRKVLLNLIKTDKLTPILNKKVDVDSMSFSAKLKALIKKTQSVRDRALVSSVTDRQLKITVKNIKGSYAYSKYIVDSSCSASCEFKPKEEKQVATENIYEENLSLKPYSVALIILKKVSDELPVDSSPQVQKAAVADVKKAQ